MYDVTKNTFFALKSEQKFIPSWYLGEPVSKPRTVRLRCEWNPGEHGASLEEQLSKQLSKQLSRAGLELLITPGHRADSEFPRDTILPPRVLAAVVGDERL